MKKIIHSLGTLFYLLFLFPSSPPGIMPAFADAEIVSHMMTRNPQWNTGCSNPIPTNTFYYNDTEADCWFHWNNASAADEIACQWYKPDGELYTEQKNLASYASGCWYSRILISGYAAEKIPGEWHVEVYFAGDLKFTEHFTLHGNPSAETCPAELLYGEDGEEIELLRYLRDTFLSRSPEGREIIRLYYRYSPAIAEALRDDEELKKEVKKMADAILTLLQ